jgi:hypothetical protein
MARHKSIVREGYMIETPCTATTGNQENAADETGIETESVECRVCMVAEATLAGDEETRQTRITSSEQAGRQASRQAGRQAGRQAAQTDEP